MQPENSCDAGLAPALLDQWEEDAADFGCVADCDRILALIAEVRRLKAAQADAWDEGWAAYHGYYEAMTRYTRDNPYRQEPSDGE